MYYATVPKYRNKKVVIDNIKFDSIKESKRYTELKLLEKAKEIHDLKLQVSFVLIPSYVINGKKTREVKYIADFTYEDKGNNFIVEDVKGYRTEVYKLKKKMFEFRYGIEIKEI